MPSDGGPESARVRERRSAIQSFHQLPVPLGFDKAKLFDSADLVIADQEFNGLRKRLEEELSVLHGGKPFVDVVAVREAVGNKGSAQEMVIREYLLELRDSSGRVLIPEFQNISVGETKFLPLVSRDNPAFVGVVLKTKRGKDDVGSERQVSLGSSWQPDSDTVEDDDKPPWESIAKDEGGSEAEEVDDEPDENDVEFSALFNSDVQEPLLLQAFFSRSFFTTEVDLLLNGGQSPFIESFIQDDSVIALPAQPGRILASQHYVQFNLTSAPILIFPKSNDGLSTTSESQSIEATVAILTWKNGEIRVEPHMVQSFTSQVSNQFDPTLSDHSDQQAVEVRWTDCLNLIRNVTVFTTENLNDHEVLVGRIKEYLGAAHLADLDMSGCSFLLEEEIAYCEFVRDDKLQKRLVLAVQVINDLGQSVYPTPTGSYGTSNERCLILLFLSSPELQEPNSVGHLLDQLHGLEGMDIKAGSIFVSPEWWNLERHLAVHQDSGSILCAFARDELRSGDEPLQIFFKIDGHHRHDTSHLLVLRADGSYHLVYLGLGNQTFGLNVKGNKSIVFRPQPNSPQQE